MKLAARTYLVVILVFLYLPIAVLVAMGFNELFQALQTGVVDGAEPELRDFYDAKWYEGQKYLSLSNYMWMANWWYANKAKLDSLPPDERKAVLDAAAATQAWAAAGWFGVVMLGIVLTALATLIQTVSLVRRKRAI